MWGFIKAVLNALLGDSPSSAMASVIPISELNDEFYDESGNVPSVPDDFEIVADAMSKKYQVPKTLICAIAFCESSFRPDAYRFEPAYKQRYVVNNPNYMGLPEAELNWLSTSWGYMQCMGNLAIELGFSFTSPDEIKNIENNVEIGTFFLRKLYNKYKNWGDCISAYNQGNNRRDKNGSYVNQEYVDRVTRMWDKYKEEIISN